MHDLLKEYIETGRIKIDKSIHEELTTVHDPCNYGRKSQKAFGHGYFEETRWITQQCCEHLCGDVPEPDEQLLLRGRRRGLGHALSKESIYYGRVKAKQIQDTGAKLVIAPCHNCRDQIMKEPHQGISI